MMFVVVLQPTKSGRIDGNMLKSVLSMVSTGRPTLICCNQMSRYLDWWKDIAQTQEACENVRNSIIEAAREKKIPCGKITVYLTELTQYSALQAEMLQRNIKSTEHVSVETLLRM